MQILKFISREDGGTYARFALVSLVAAATNAGILMIVNLAASTTYGTITNFYLFFVFLLTVTLYWVAQRQAFAMIARDVEATVLRTRLRILGLVRRCELLTIEAMGEARILNALSSQTQVLSQSMSQVTMGVQAVLITLLTGGYIAYVSRPAFALWLVSVTLSTLLILREWKATQDRLGDAHLRDATFQDTSAALLHGFKEVKLSRGRAEGLLGELGTLARASYDFRIEAQKGMTRSYVSGQVMFFMLVGAMVFLLPALGDISVATLGQATTAILFVLGPVSMVIGAIPALASAEAAARSLIEMEAVLTREVASEANARPLPPERRGFQSLELKNVVFRYPPGALSDGFAIGPIDFRVTAGEIVFITGGNGAGKSTFLRLLTGLYRPESGTVLLDGRAVDPDDLQILRDRIAAVFADYFLFHKLYGIEADPVVADALLEEMEIADKTSLQGDSFTTTRLSTGQRKRLALIAAVMDARSVLVLDEWAADQDPIFRRKFYEEVLPSLKRRGITVIAATHDDRWFHVADRHIRLADGRIHEEAASIETAAQI
ncbi:MAG: cyclic peptide export transporter [Roseomonas sp.]|nr:cyclic peptide export transporter [Roseomonas sp.]